MSGVRTWHILEQGDELVLALNGEGNDAARVPRAELNELCAHLVALQIRQSRLPLGGDDSAFGESNDD